MRYRWLIFWIVSLTLVTALIGCNGTHRYDSRLTAADSLMQVDPDSALALVMAVSPDSLTGEGDRAYRDLLLTQARYKCYIVATSDSDINRALAYYRIHSSEREKLTRAYIYKGAVMEELGHPDSAMLYYKHAETTAAHDDYFNLGYVNMCMGALYRDHYAMDGKDVQKYEEALKYLMQTSEQHYQLVCMINLGSLYRLKQNQKAEHMLMQAREMAKEIHDTANFILCNQNLISMYNYYGRYNDAKPLIQKVLSLRWKGEIDMLFFTEAACVYVATGQIDSADYLLNQIPDVSDLNPVNELSRLQCLSDIALAKCDTMTHLRLEYRAKMINDSLLADDHVDHISFAEAQIDKAIAEQTHEQQMKSAKFLILMLTIFFVMIVLLVAKLRKSYQNHRKEIIQISEELEQTLEQLKEKQICALQEKQQEQASATELFKYRLDALNELFNSIKFKSEDKQQGKIRDIIPLSSVIMGLSDNYSVLKIELSDQFWEKMKRSVDGEYNGIVSFVENKYPELTLKERRLFCLLCANISPQIIRLCMNYSNVKSVTNNRSIIIKKKMGLDMTLEEFRDSYMKNQL